jgi:TatD DNase family protein
LRLTDSHCHLPMSDDGESAIDRARDAGVHGFLVPATHLGDTADAIRVAQSHPDVWAAVGFHPHEAKDCDGHALVEIDRLAREPRVVAIGEIGLDYHYEHSPREVQKKVFAEHLRIALANDLPVVIHNRESTEDLLSILRRADLSGLRGVLHSFTENWEVAKDLLDLGYYLSFSGIVTFRSAGELREVARRVPADRVLIETDTPYLAPVPHRGKTNEPAFVKHVAEVVAELWGMDLERVAELTTENFSRLFRVKVPG